MPERRTPLYEIHLRTASKMVKGGGDYMYPLSYTSPTEEHVNTRTNVGMQDLSTMGKEPILDGDKVLGYITSTNFEYSVGTHIAYGYIPTEYAQKGTEVEAENLGKRYKATVNDDPLYDPKMEKLRA